MARDQDRVQAVRAPGGDADGLDHGQALTFERTQQSPLAVSRPRGQLLQCVQRPVVLDEPHDVPADAADQVDEPWRRPLLERRVPGQVEEARVTGTCDEFEARGHSTAAARTACAR